MGIFDFSKEFKVVGATTAPDMPLDSPSFVARISQLGAAAKQALVSTLDRHCRSDVAKMAGLGRRAIEYSPVDAKTEFFARAAAIFAHIEPDIAKLSHLANKGLKDRHEFIEAKEVMSWSIGECRKTDPEMFEIVAGYLKSDFESRRLPTDMLVGFSEFVKQTDGLMKTSMLTAEAFQANEKSINDTSVVDWFAKNATATARPRI